MRMVIDMPEIANCPLCGRKPFQYHYDEHIAYAHCGVKCDTLEIWNRYAAAMEVSKLRAEYYYECDNMGVEEQQELWDMISDANKRVLEVFNDEQFPIPDDCPLPDAEELL